MHAIIDARIVPAPGRLIERGSIVIRDGLVVEVGENVALPADARVHSGAGATGYVFKSRLADDLTSAVEAALRNATFVSKSRTERGTS